MTGNWLQNSYINSNTIMGELHIIVSEDTPIKLSVVPIMGEARNPDSSKVNSKLPSKV